MEVIFLSKFNKDLDKIKDKRLKDKLYKVIEDVENTKSISQIKGIKKMTIHQNSYRIRIGNYRIGIYFENNVIEFARLVHRKDIYKVFPK